MARSNWPTEATTSFKTGMNRRLGARPLLFARATAGPGVRPRVLALLTDTADTNRAAIGAMVDPEIVAGQGVAVGAVRLSCVPGNDGVATEEVGAQVHGLQVCRVDAPPIPTKVVNSESGRYRAHPVFIGPTVGWDATAAAGAGSTGVEAAVPGLRTSSGPLVASVLAVGRDVQREPFKGGTAHRASRFHVRNIQPARVEIKC